MKFRIQGYMKVPREVVARASMPKPVVPRPPADLKPRGVVRQVVGFAAEWAKWNAAGRPARTEEEQAKCQAICRECKPYWNPERNKCRICGCGKMMWEWATKHCPINKW